MATHAQAQSPEPAEQARVLTGKYNIRFCLNIKLKHALLVHSQG